MRNLGHGQSVVFCAPPEVDRDILRLEKLGPSDQTQVVEILSWAMFNTCEDIKTHIPHWVQQGINSSFLRYKVIPPSFDTEYEYSTS